MCTMSGFCLRRLCIETRFTSVEKKSYQLFEFKDTIPFHVLLASILQLSLCCSLRELHSVINAGPIVSIAMRILSRLFAGTINCTHLSSVLSDRTILYSLDHGIRIKAIDENPFGHDSRS